MKKKLLLTEDVYGLGRSGDIVTAKPGYVRNFLIPQRKAVIAGEYSIRLQEKLREERAKQAIVDKKEAGAFAAKLVGKVITTTVKVDQEGHMYGSVNSADIAKMLKEQLEVMLDRRNIILSHGIKTLGVHEVNLKLKEGVPAKVTLQIKAEGGMVEKPAAAPAAPAEAEIQEFEEGEEEAETEE
ncbi:MAG: 50S ribosomal protein L9 [Chlamydiae bacterium]|nr:50S ribosomal protein L9 [Chlamydiota bacterium]